MTKRLPFLFAGLIAALLLMANSAHAQGVADLRLFEQRCTTCHGNPKGPAGAPDGVQLRKMMPEAVYAALSNPMHPQVQNVTDADKRMIAGYLGGRKIDVAKVADAKLMPNQCASNPPIANLSKSPSWNGWGADPPMRASNLQKPQVSLRLKCPISS